MQIPPLRTMRYYMNKIPSFTDFSLYFNFFIVDSTSHASSVVPTAAGDFKLPMPMPPSAAATCTCPRFSVHPCSSHFFVSLHHLFYLPIVSKNSCNLISSPSRAPMSRHPVFVCSLCYLLALYVHKQATRVLCGVVWKVAHVVGRSTKFDTS